MLIQGSCHCGLVHYEVDSQTLYPFNYCYCSICRKTAGGGGYAINIMGNASTLKIKGKEHISIYNAVKEDGELSSANRHFCNKCASCLWVFDPEWPQWIYPFASSIDTPLPKAPERVHFMLNYAAPWCNVPQNAHDKNLPEYPEESIEDWHKTRGLFL